ncbi:hypothetical protein Tco_1100524 [Tanacetum coccineum]
MDSKDMLCSFSGMGEKIIELEKALAKQTKENSDLSMKIDNLEYAFAFELKKKTTDRMTAFEEEKRVFVSKITHLEQIIAQQTKDFENAKIESETCVFQIKIVELENTLAKQTKENSDLLMKIDNLENAFADEVKRVTTGKLNDFDKENCDFGSKVTHLEKIITQKIKDFDDVKLELSNRTAKFEAYFKNLKKRIVFLNDNCRKVDDSKVKKDQFWMKFNHLENLNWKKMKGSLCKLSLIQIHFWETTSC